MVLPSRLYKCVHVSIYHISLNRLSLSLQKTPVKSKGIYNLTATPNLQLSLAGTSILSPADSRVFQPLPPSLPPLQFQLPEDKISSKGI